MRISTSATIFLFSLFFITSCTVQKRVHRKGWHLEWRGQNRPSPSKRNTPPTRSLSSKDSVQAPFLSTLKPMEENTTQEYKMHASKNEPFRLLKENPIKNGSFRPSNIKVSEIPYYVSPYRFHQKQKTQKQYRSSVRVPWIGYLLIILGFLLGLLGIFLLIVNALSTASGGAALYGLVFIFIGALLIVFAFNIAVSSLGTKNTPNPEQSLPKKEKKERQPLQKKDKIMLVVFAALLLTIGISILAF